MSERVLAGCRSIVDRHPDRHPDRRSTENQRPTVRVFKGSGRGG
ncbi:hypothetical protein [Streptomyces phaeolivaceus]|nr:hypothetical protein [Streptomyces phaeolivaceus]